jgi:ABC-2 type transport system ATP-binding protein
MGVRDYLAFMAEIKRIERERRKKAVGQAIEECGLAEVARRTIGNLSKGFRQRVSLAQAVLGDPPVLILDEPTVGLDPRQIIEVRQMIKDMGGRRTVLLSTHILPEVSMTCGKVVVIDRGRLVASGTPEKLVSTVRVENPIHVAIEGDAQLAESVLMQTPGVRRVRRDRWISARRISFEVTPGAETDPRAEIARRIVEAGLRLIELSSPGGSLEDVFLQVISASEGG